MYLISGENFRSKDKVEIHYFRKIIFDWAEKRSREVQEPFLGQFSGSDEHFVPQLHAPPCLLTLNLKSLHPGTDTNPLPRWQADSANDHSGIRWLTPDAGIVENPECLASCSLIADAAKRGPLTSLTPERGRGLRRIVLQRSERGSFWGIDSAPAPLQVRVERPPPAFIRNNKTLVCCLLAGSRPHHWAGTETFFWGKVIYVTTLRGADSIKNLKFYILPITLGS